MIFRFKVILFVLVVTAEVLSAAAKPKLVVIVSIDQFRKDYVDRFEKYFGEGGFRLFLDKGIRYENAHFEHATTKTGPGHAAIASGTYGNRNGIISNDWYDRETGKKVYCVEDLSTKTIHFARSPGRSPRNLLSSTVGDELRKSNNGHSKVISVSRKDRAAILMGGKLADAAYWTVDSLFTTSTYYMEQLPAWVEEWNNKSPINKYFGQIWERALPDISVYNAEVGPDDAAGERGDNGLDTEFPHKIDGGKSSISGSFYSAFNGSPFENEALVDFVIRAIEAEMLGQREVSDILCLSLSANDAVGHKYGPHSHEVMDITIRTDRVLARLFSFIDSKIGLSNCVLVVTADHGVMDMPEIETQLGRDAGAMRVSSRHFRDPVEKKLAETFGPLEGGYLSQDHTSLYFKPAALKKTNFDPIEAEGIGRSVLLGIEEVHDVFTRSQLLNEEVTTELGRKVMLSFDRFRSGDIIYITKPMIVQKPRDETDHGSPWDYDNHVPVMWYVPGAMARSYYRRIGVTDIAPTVSALLHIPFPSAVEGDVLKEVVK